MKTEPQVREYLKQWREIKANSPEVSVIKENVIAALEFVLDE